MTHILVCSSPAKRRASINSAFVHCVGVLSARTQRTVSPSRSTVMARGHSGLTGFIAVKDFTAHDDLDVVNEDLPLCFEGFLQGVESSTLITGMIISQ